MEGKTIENILINLDMKNTVVTTVEDFTIIIFWNVMTPNGGLPTGDLLTAIESAFELLKSLKQNLVRQEQHNLVQVGLGFVFTKVEN
jgi:Fe-Mn family superoxide dismutase